MKVKIYEHLAKEKRHPEKFVFVHHMLGSHRTTKRHRLWLSKQGYDCYSFDLIFGSRFQLLSISPTVLYSARGVFFLWKKQITKVLDQIEGEKVVYAFSGPALSAILACRGRTDIKKIIVDGGPFAEVEQNTRNLFRHEVGFESVLLINPLSFVGSILWGLKSIQYFHKTLDRWNPAIPILSIRGMEDPIVPPSTIEQIFEKHKNKIPLEVFEVPEGKHLDGLKRFFKIYKPRVMDFIGSPSQPPAKPT